MKNTIILISLILILASCGYKKLGFFDKKQYLLFKEFPFKACGLVDLCFNEVEATLWRRDSLGERGDRKQLLEEYKAYFLEGEFNGISHACMISLLGKPSRINSLFSPNDSTFRYKIYEDESDEITLKLTYNLAMDKIVGSQLSYLYKELPVPSPACPDAYFSRIDSILARKYLMDFSKTRRRPEAERYWDMDKDLNGLPIGCYMCYQGPPTYFWIGNYTGIYGKEEKFTAMYKSHGGSRFELTLSLDSARILDTEYERVFHDK